MSEHNVFLGIDNPIILFLAKVFDLIVLNVLFIICSIPIITLGSSLTALYSVTLKMAKNEESYIVRGFFKDFKTNFKQSICIWLPSLLIGVFLFFDFCIVFTQDVAGLSFFYAPLVIIAIIYFCVLLYSYPIIAHFKCTLSQVIKNTFYIITHHIFFTLLMIAAPIAITIILFICTGYALSILLGFFTIIGFSTCAYLYSFVFRRIFAKYE